MEEGRRNFLTYQIISGLKFITVERRRYKLIAPSKELRLLAEHVYQDTIYSLRFDNLITQDKATLFLLRLGIWRPNDDGALKKLETYLEDKKIDLYHALYDMERQKRVRRTIKGIKLSINKSYIRKHSLDYMTLDYHALITKRKFLTAMCLRDEQNNAVYSEKDFWNSDSTILERVTDKLDSDIVAMEDFRELARNEPWRSMWSLGKESCIGSSVAEWTDEQKNLVAFAKMYDNAYQNPECPSDGVFEDDDMFDGWMIDQRRKREKDQKQKQADTMNNIPDKAQEVFMNAPTREDADRIYGLNDMTSRMKIQHRQRVIKERGSVEAKDLPDTQMELRNQQMQEYKDKMKRGK
jgi:hypothetical protein